VTYIQVWSFSFSGSPFIILLYQLEKILQIYEHIDEIKDQRVISYTIKIHLLVAEIFTNKLTGSIKIFEDMD
jgi:hypothetical protein